MTYTTTPYEQSLRNLGDTRAPMRQVGLGWAP